MNFADKFRHTAQRNRSLLCLGLDPDPQLMPEGVSVVEFGKEIIDATSDLVCAYKPNLAFYEALGLKGMPVLQKTVNHIPQGIPVIGDAKRGDIGNTARAYATALFEVFGFDAATVNPYLGYDSIEPFLNYTDKGVFVLCRTSNPGAVDFQSLLCQETGDSTEPLPLFELVALKAKRWNRHGNIGLVVGATYPEELRRIRGLCPEMILLIPGIGTQQGSLPLAVRYGTDRGGEKAIFSSSRQILYASRGRDFAMAARRVAQQLCEEVRAILSDLPSSSEEQG